MKVGDLAYIDYGPHSDVPRFLVLIIEVEVDPDGLDWNTLVRATSVESGKVFVVNKIDIKEMKCKLEAPNLQKPGQRSLSN